MSGPAVLALLLLHDRTASIRELDRSLLASLARPPVNAAIFDVLHVGTEPGHQHDGHDSESKGFSDASLRADAKSVGMPLVVIHGSGIRL